MTNTRHHAVWPKGVAHHIDVPERSVAENLMLTAARDPDGLAILYYGARFNWRTLADQVERLAGWLQHHAGVAKGDRVLLFQQNSPYFVICYYAILRADAVVVAVNPMNKAAELAHLAADTGAHVCLAGQELLAPLAALIDSGAVRHVVACACADACDPAFDFTLPAPLDAPGRDDYGDARITPLARACAAGHRPGPITAGPDDLAVIPYTSGTTGHPKGCMHTHRTVMTTIVGGLIWNPAGAGAASLVSLPLFHVTGMQNSMNGPVMSGDTMVMMTRWDRRLAATLIQRHRITRWRNITTMAIDMVNDPDIAAFDLSSLRSIGGGGASMPASVAARLKELTNLDYIEGFGMSETMAATHINPVDAPRQQCLGIPVFDVDARVMDPDKQRELGTGDVGEIIIAAPQVMTGYWNNPDATRAAFVDIDGTRFLRTGDIGYYDAHGYFYLTDRLKRMISVSGFKVWPTEVEAILHANPAIGEVCIVSRPDPRQGEAVVAVVVARQPVTAQALIAWCRENMSAYKCPTEIRFVDALPRSSSGKVQWRQVQADLNTGPRPPRPQGEDPK